MTKARDRGADPVGAAGGEAPEPRAPSGGAGQGDTRPPVSAATSAPDATPASRDALGSALRAVWRSARSSLGPLLIPLIPGVVLVTGAYLATGWLQQRQFQTIRRGVEAEAGRLGREFDVGLMRRVREVESAARATADATRGARGVVGLGDPGGAGSSGARAASTAPEAERWRLTVQPLAFQDHEFRALLWLDGTLAVRAVAPPTERLFSTLYPEDDDLRRVALQSVILGPPRDASAGFVTGSVALPSGERELLVAAPMSGGGSSGSDYLAAVVRVHDLLDALASTSLKRGYSVTVYEGPYLLFGPRWDQGGSPAQYARDAAVLADGLALRVQVWPGEELARQLESPAPLIVLGLGVAVAFLTSLSIYLARTPTA